MKLAEALIMRADYQKRFNQLKHRVLVNAKVQSGDQPAEEPQSLLAEMEEVSEATRRLIQQINRTNAGVVLEGNITLADALATRDILRQRQAAYRELAMAASVTQDRYSRSEVRFVSTVDVAALQQSADSVAQACRELDTRIQEANWLTELQE
jgi:hypothetical protein